MRISRREGLKALGGLAGLAIGTSKSSAQNAAPRNVLRVVPKNQPTIWDPHWLGNYPTRDASLMCFDTLFSTDSKGKIVPQMVGDYEISPHLKKFSFKLRPGLLWHDGEKVRAADCVASLRRWMKRDGIGQMINAVLESLTADTDEAFTLLLKEPSAIVLEGLGKAGSVVPFMMPERFAVKDDLGSAYRPLGSGPFIFNNELYRPGSRIVWDKNPHYVPRAEPADFQSGGKRVNVDRVEFVILPNSNSAVAALQAGEVDYLQWVPYDDIDTLRSDSGVRVVDVDPFGKQGYLRPNHLIPPFDNPKMREALLYLVDQDVYLRAITGNHPDLFLTCNAYFLCELPEATQAGAVKPSLEKAKALMAEAGYKGEPIKLFVTTDLQANAIGAQVTAQLMRKAGFKVEEMPFDITTIIARRQAKDTWNLSWGYLESFDAGPLANQYFRANCDKAMAGWPCDAKLEALRLAYAKATDAETRKTLIDELQKQAYQVLPYIPTGEYRVPSAVRSNIKNVLTSGAPVFWNITKESA